MNKIGRQRVSLAITILLTWSHSAYGDDQTDPMDGQQHFFDMTATMQATQADGQVTLRATGEGDAFVRWGKVGGGFLAMQPERDVLEVDISSLGRRGRAHVRLEFADQAGQWLGGAAWFKRLREPGVIALPSIRAFAEEQGIQGAARFQIFFRLPRGRELQINEIRVLQEPSPAALPYLQRLELEKLQLKIETGQQIPVIDARQPELTRPRLTIRNISRQPMEVEATFTATSFLGQEEAVDHPAVLKLAPGEAWETLLPLGDRRYDAWAVHYILKRGKAERRAEAYYALMPFNTVEPMPIEGFHYAINGGRFDKPEAEVRKTVAAHAALGVTHVRGDLTWAAIQPSADVWQWDKIDRSFSIYAEHGIEPQVLLGYSTPWAVDPAPKQTDHASQWMFVPPDLDAWTRYVSEAAQRYADQVTFWEVWNEPDLWNFWRGDTEQYIELLRASYDAIHKNDPHAQVMTGGFATLMPHGGRRHVNLQRDVLLQAADAFDVHAFHQHGAFDAFANIVEGPLAEMRDAMPEPRPLYFNETAVGRGQGHAYQAESLVKKVAFTRRRGAIGYAWFTLVSGESFPWGIMIRDHEPLPAYVAYNALIRELGQLPFARALDLGEGNLALLFGNEQRSLLIVWSQSKDASRGLATIRVDQRHDEVRVLDLFGNATAAKTVGERVILPITRRPVYLTMPMPPEAIHADPRILVVDGPVMAYGSHPVETAIELFNPFDQTITLTIKSDDMPEQTRRVEPQQSARLPIVMTLPNDPGRRFGDHLDKSIRLSVEPMGLEHKVVIPVVAGVFIPIEAAPDRPADLRVNDRPDVQSLFEFDPQSLAMVWQGPRDLSVETWIDRSDDHLNLRFDIRDDVHQIIGDDAPKADALTLLIVPDPTKPASRMIIRFADAGDGEAKIEMLPTAGEAIEADAVAVQIVRKKSITNYTVRLDLDALGINRQRLADGVGLNFAAYDSDLGVRESWAQLAPGMDQLEESGKTQTILVRFEID